MKMKYLFLLSAICLKGMIANAQGWTALVSMDINHGDYAMEQYTGGSITFSGITQTVPATTPGGAWAYFTFQGTGTPVATISASVTGIASFPYNMANPTTLSLSVSNSATNFAYTDCTSKTFYKSTSSGELTINITIYPRMVIETPNLLNDITCSSVALRTNTCSNSYSWEVRDDGAGIWKSIPKNTASITMTPDELGAVGLASKYGKKFFRVTGQSGTTSQEEIVNVPAKAPTVEVSAVHPDCTNGTGGVSFTIVSAMPGTITQFVATLFLSPDTPVDQISNATSGGTFSGVDIKKSYKVRVQNNSSTDVYGSCFAEAILASASFVNPPPVTLQLDPTLHNGYAISCAGKADGIITATPGGGTSSYQTYIWTGAGNVGNTAVVSGLRPGTYKAQVKDSKGCPSPEVSVTLSEPDTLKVTATSKGGKGSYDVSCLDMSDGMIEAKVEGGISSPAPTYAWSNSSSFTGSIQSGLGVNTYIVTVTDDNDCVASDDITLKAPPVINFDISKVNALNCPGDETSLEVKNLQNTIGDPHYSWTTGSTTAATAEVAFGTYSVTVSDDQGCSKTKSYELIDPPGLTVTLIPVAAHNGKYISCDGEDDGAFDAQVKDKDGNIATATSYSWKREGVGIPGTAASIGGLNKGNYTVTIGYGAGCLASDSKFLDDPDPVVPVISISSTSAHNGFHISCPGKSDGSLHATASGGTPWSSPTPAYTFQWDGGPSAPDITGKGAGTYRVVATDRNGCTGEAFGTLVNPPPINPSISLAALYNGKHVKCHNDANGKLNANATGGAGALSYNWSRGDTGAQLLNVAPGDYTVTISDANGCTETSTAFTVINPAPVVANTTIFSNFNSRHISCAGASDGWLKATASGGTNSFSFSWDTGVSGPDLAGVQAGTYTVTATDQNGCSDTHSTTLLDPPTLVASIPVKSDYNGFNITCYGEDDGFLEAAGVGGTGTYSFLWSPTNENSFRVESIPQGTYQVTITDVNGCTDTESYTLIEPPVLEAAISNAVDLLCHEVHTGSFDVIASGGASTAYQYTLDNLKWRTTPSFAELAADVYTATVRDVNQCIATASETLTQPPKIEVAFANQPAFCADPRGESKATVTGGVGAYSYLWKDAADQTLGTTNTISALSGGIYTLKVRDGNDCVVSESTGIVTTDGPQAEIINVLNPSCSYSADGAATVNVFAGNSPFTFLWPSGQTTAMGSNLADGTYLVTIRDVNDCPTVKEVKIDAPAELDISVADMVLPNCFGECNGKITVQSSGGTAPYSFKWTEQAGPQATGLCVGTHTVTVVDSKNCTSTEQFVLDEPEVLSIQLESRVLPLCAGNCNGSLSIVAKGGNGDYTYDWSSDATGPNAEGLCAGDHVIRVVDKKGCELEKTYSLGEPSPLLVKEIKNQSPICHDGCDGLVAVQATGGTGGYSFAWNTSSTLSELNGLCPGSYSVSVVDENKCETSGTFTIQNPARLTVDLGGSVTLCTGQTHVLDPGAQWTSYLWRSNVGFSATTQTVTIREPGQYWVDLINNQGCLAQDTFLLETSLDLLRANMIMASQASVGDTVAIIDVSWPLPDNITWEFPNTMKKLIDLGDVVLGKFDQAGVHVVSLSARLGECRDRMTKTISILETEESAGGGRLGYDAFVKEFILYPNPTNGSFEVGVELAEVSPVTLSVWSTMTGQNIAKATGEERKEYLMRFDLRPMAAGPYVLRLDHKQGYQTIRFIVN